MEVPGELSSSVDREKLEEEGCPARQEQDESLNELRISDKGAAFRPPR